MTRIREEEEYIVPAYSMFRLSCTPSTLFTVQFLLVINLRKSRHQSQKKQT